MLSVTYDAILNRYARPRDVDRLDRCPFVPRRRGARASQQRVRLSDNRTTRVDSLDTVIAVFIHRLPRERGKETAVPIAADRFRGGHRSLEESARVR
jgi:hypothetical protein